MTVPDWSLIGLTARLVFTVSAAIAAVVLIARAGRRWWQRVVPGVLLAAVVVGVGVSWVVDRLQLFEDYSMPVEVLVWIGAAAAGVGFGIASLVGAGWRRCVVVVSATFVLVGSAVAGINGYYGYFPDVRSALGLRLDDEVDFSAVPPATPRPMPSEGQRTSLEQWVKPVGLPSRGVVTHVPIGSPVSGFRATRDAFVYLPPAYLTASRPLLPVLILFHSSPGQPSSWIIGGGVAKRMDRFAAAHRGLAPIVVMPDTTGALMANPMCIDSRLGNSESYLTRDVPDWIRRNLQVNPDRRVWAVGGYSSGGTCALQLALRRPDLFPTFLDIAGQVEPTLGNRHRTVDRAFGGDSAKFVPLTPLEMLARTKFPGTSGRIYDATGDLASVAQQQLVIAACRRNGIDVQFSVVPGAHNWYAWTGAFDRALPWLGVRLGIERSQIP